jgi:hypothetical protein
MRTIHHFMLAAALAGCTTNADTTAKFVGSWKYNAGSTVAVDCGQGPSEVPFDTIVETFAETGGLLAKSDSQGCTGLEFTVASHVASLSAAGQSCVIPANASSPSATFAPSTYTFTLSRDETTLAESLSATYTQAGSPSGCAVTAANTLTRE